MAPDINTLPTSPRPLPLRQPSNSATLTEPISTSRRTSQVMGPPSVPASATSPALHRSPVISARSQEQNVPLRHPRPLTAAELYAECEKEQEAVVNRLTRELTALRAQSASVASNASISSSSTTASLLPVDISDPNPTHQIIGATHPTPSRRHRSSSSLSARSILTPGTSVSAAGSAISTQPQAGSIASAHPTNVSQASHDRAAAAAGANLSRQPSASNRSGASTPARQSMDNVRYPTSTAGGIPGGGTLYTLPHRPSLSRDTSFASSTAAHAGTPQIPHPLPSPAQSPGMQVAMPQHYADTAAYRSEMEIVKAENETLRQRVRALERALRTRRRDSSQSDAQRPEHLSSSIRSDAGLRITRDREISATSPSAAAAGPAGIAAWAAGDGGVGGVAGPRERSESQSTTASSRRGVGGGALVGEDEVRVGESAGSVGIGRGV